MPRITLPHSEVCMHLGVAGRSMLVGPARHDPRGLMAQLYDNSGRPFSAPITRGEAGWLGIITVGDVVDGGMPVWAAGVRWRDRSDHWTECADCVNSDEWRSNITTDDERAEVLVLLGGPVRCDTHEQFAEES